MIAAVTPNMIKQINWKHNKHSTHTIKQNANKTNKKQNKLKHATTSINQLKQPKQTKQATQTNNPSKTIKQPIKENKQAKQTCTINWVQRRLRGLVLVACCQSVSASARWSDSRLAQVLRADTPYAIHLGWLCVAEAPAQLAVASLVSLLLPQGVVSLSVTLMCQHLVALERVVVMGPIGPYGPV